MTTLTLQQALDLLRTQPGQYNTAQALYDLAAQVNVNATGWVTVLYSGQPANGVRVDKILDAMQANGENIRIIDNTDAAKFLGSPELREALALKFGLSAEDLDILQLGTGVLASDIILRRDNNSLVLSINGTTDAVTIKNYFFGGGSQIEQIKFADGTLLNLATIKARALAGSADADTLYGYAGADTLSAFAGAGLIYGRNGNDTMDGGTDVDSLYGDDGDNLLRDGAHNDTVDGGNGSDNLQGQEDDDALYGQASNDTLDAAAGNDTLDGGAGNDTLLLGKGSGNDSINAYDTTAGKLDIIQLGAGVLNTSITLKRDADTLVLSINGTNDSLRVSSFFNADASGGYQVEQIKFADALYGYATANTLSACNGNDSVWGRAGNDTYLFGKGSGKDLISSYDTTTGKLDIVQLGAGILASGVTLARDFGALLISINETNDTLRVSNFFDNDPAGGYQIEQIKFADNTFWDIAAIKARALAGTNADDTLYGYAGADTISALSGDDSVSGRSGNDTLDGGAGNDIISQYDSSGTENDRVIFGADITEGQIWFQRIGNDLQLSLIDTQDSLTVRNWYSGSAYRVDGFSLANNKQLLENQVDALVSAMAGFAPPAPGQTALPTIYQTTLNPVFAASWK